MTNRTKFAIAALVLLQLAAVGLYFFVESRRAVPLSTEPPRPVDGRVASFEVTTREGDKTELVGGDQSVLVHFWATWCAPCIDELPLVLSLPDGPIRVVAVALDDDWTKIDKFASPDPRIVRANAKEAEAKFEISSLPQTVLMAPDGRLLLRVNGARDWSDANFWKSFSSSQF